MQNTAPELQPLYVSVAVIRQGQKVLISKRADHVPLGGLWEFPGGKQERGENAQQAMVRECQEELDITPTRFRPLIRLHYPLQSLCICLSVFLVEAFSGRVKAKEQQPLRWVKQPDLVHYDFPKINQKIIHALNLPQRYCITPEVEQNSAHWLAQLEQNIKKQQIRFLQFRSKKIMPRQRRTLVAQLKYICVQHDCTLLVNAPLQEWPGLEMDSVHLSASALRQVAANDLKNFRWVAASCHSLQELQLAEQKNCHFALLSPLNKTQTHPQARPLGWHKFHQWVDQVNIPVYALGGMQNADIDIAWQHGGQGIAAIGACL